MNSIIELPIIHRELVFIGDLNFAYRLFDFIEDSYGVKIQKFIQAC
jgi:hypothetical protein